MAAISQPQGASLRAAWIEQAQAHPWTTLGLVVSTLGVLVLLGTSIALVLAGAAQAPLRLALLGGTGAFGATALGALPGFALHRINQRLEDSMLGFAAGAMIFVVSHEVIPETHRNGHQTPATLGLMVGFALMMVLNTTLG
jgi:ZIP family zinc transporter